ncbi:DUF6624 domain-containing protein [Arundinibacter roseus]|uniref:Uncharacterized protein n=1 Tax=Arundinibacter roseus TaxID=2070510 RepID=A0A4R4KIL4_9BACT|nr:DUF6624 domain-containing protein [Arundinibacter roseus]TDB68047.1 hypothetical protein EZE20_03740 [Arundinibacter roseus]
MIPEIAKTILSLRDADLKLRNELIQKGQLSDGYNPKMAELHNRNAAKLEEIIEEIGYPTADKVGEEASEAAWLVIQHAIGQPDFMKKCHNLLESAIESKQANARQLAYLTDRIAVLEGNPQLYGTQFDWNESGELVPNDYDDLSLVNQRRQAIGLNTLEEQTELLQKQVKIENQSPPADYKKRRQEMNAWRKAVGWVEE